MDRATFVSLRGFHVEAEEPVDLNLASGVGRRRSKSLQVATHCRPRKDRHRNLSNIWISYYTYTFFFFL